MPRSKSLWVLEAAVSRAGKDLVATLVVAGARGELGDIATFAAQTSGFDQVQVRSSRPLAQVSENAPHALAATMDDRVFAWGALAYSNARDVPFDAPLSVSQLQNVVPLGPMPPETQPPCVPDAVVPIAWGQPTGWDIPFGTFALLEASRCQGLPERLAASGLEHRCLFTGQTAETYGDVAPWLVRLEDGNSFTRALFTFDPEDEIDAALWDKELFVIVRSPLSLEGLWRHFRRFTQVTDEKTRRKVFFRFWAPETIRTLVVSMAEADQLALCRGVAVFCCSDGSGGLISLHRDGIDLST